MFKLKNLFKRKEKTAKKPKKQIIVNRNKLIKFGSFFIAGFLFCGTVGASAGTAYYAVKNHKNASDFESTYNIRYELDLNSNENPLNPISAPTSVDDPDLVANVKKCVSSYTNYLNDKQINVTNIYPEIYKDQDGSVRAFINAVVPNQKVSDPKDTSNKEKVNKNKTEIYFEDLYSPRLSIFFHDTNKANYIITREDLVGEGDAEHSNRFVAPNNSTDNAFYVHLLGNNFKDIKTHFKDSNPSDDKDKNGLTGEQPYMYIINDQQGFFNRLNYILKIYHLSNGGKGAISEWNDIYNYWLQPSEKTFCEDYAKIYTSDSTLESLNINDGKSAFDGSGSQAGARSLDYAKIFSDDIMSDGKRSSFIESVEPQTDQADVVKHPGALRYTFMSKWIIGVITNESDGTSSYTKYLPDKNPTKTTRDSNDEWLVLNSPASSKFDTNLIRKEFSNYAFPYKIKDIVNTNWVEKLTSLTASGESVKNIPSVISRVNSSIKSNIFGSSATFSTFIVMLVILLLVGIIVSILYKIPGVIAFGLMTMTMSITSLCLVSGGYGLSISFLMGMMGIVILGTFSIVNYFERYLKQIANNYDMETCTKRTFLSSIWPCIDLHVIVLLIGVVLVYFGSSVLATAGVCLVFGSLLSFVINYLLLNGFMFILFGNQANLTMYNLLVYWRKKLIAKFDLRSKDNKDLNKMSYFNDAPKLAIKAKDEKTKSSVWTKISNFFKTSVNRTEIFSWRQIVWPSICLILVIIGLILVFTVGVHNSYSFYGGTRIVAFIPNAGFFQLPDFMKSLKALDGSIHWYNVGLNNGNYLYLYTSSTFNFETVSNWAIWSTVGIDKANIMVSSINSNPIMNSVHGDINLLLIVSGLITLYSFLRHGWVSAIPMFIGLVFGPLLTLSVITIFQLYFDTNIIYSAIIVYLICALFTFNNISNINNTWFKQKATDLKSIKKMMNEQLYNSRTSQIYLFIFTFLISLCLIVFGSTTLVSFGYVMMIGTVIGALISRFIAPVLMAYFLLIKNKYLKNLTVKALLVKNYDTLDEELIDGVNKINKESVYL